eukprot:3901881-Amphidinium_carterae.1
MAMRPLAVDNNRRDTGFSAAVNACGGSTSCHRESSTASTSEPFAGIVSLAFPSDASIEHQKYCSAPQDFRTEFVLLRFAVRT